MPEKKTTKPNRKLSRLEKIAFHEAGHAVISLKLGIPVRRATIVPADDGSLGHVLSSGSPKWFKPDRQCDARTKRYLRKRVITLMAGCIAEKRRAGRHSHKFADSNYHKAVNLVDQCQRRRERDGALSWTSRGSHREHGRQELALD